MDDVALIESLRGWIILEPGSKAFLRASAVRCYERMGNYLLARLGDGAFVTAAQVVAFAVHMQASLREDQRRGADQEHAEAMISFWRGVVLHLASLVQTAPVLAHDNQPQVAELLLSAAR